MKKYKIQIAVLSLILTIKVNAQQIPQFTQLLQNRHMLNPAASGEYEQHNVLAGFRKQWAGLEHSPTTYYLGYNTSFIKRVETEHNPLAIRTARTEEYNVTQTEGFVSKFKHGIGGYAMVDNYGAFKSMNFNINYALHTALNDKINASIGVNTRFNNTQFDANLAEVEMTGDETYNAFVAERKSLTSLELDLGVYFYADNWFLGYSTNQLTGDAIAFSSITNNILKTHHTIIGGYTLNASDNVDLTPSFIMKTVEGAPLSVDFLLNTMFREQVSVGAGYRMKDAIMILVGYKYDEKYRIGYSYDISIGGLSGVNSGSHEITLGVTF